MKIAVIGLGKMGHQFVVRLKEDNHQVIVFDRDQSLVESAVKAGGLAATSREDVVSKFDSETVIVWLMIPSSVVEEEVKAWKSLLPAGSILIDGGNSDYRLSVSQASDLAERQIEFLDIGVSGGILGLKNGFSIMVGGNQATAETIDPILKSLSKPSGAYRYVGPSGSGHFVKMVHNAIEYGLMESLAEGYNLLKNGPYQNLDLGEIAEVWQHGSIVESSLNSLAGEIFATDQNLEGVDGVVAESGETRWSLEVAKERGIELPAVEAAFNVRLKSQQGQTSFATKFLAALRNKFGGHNINPNGKS
jgi:6-phosphogluconate dehydrogenase